MAGTRTFTDTKIKQGYDSADKRISNWVQKTDGSYMCCWMDETSKELQIGFSADLDFLTVDYSIESVATIAAITVGTYSSGQTSLFRRADGKVLLFIVNPLKTDPWVKCYISNNGNGTDWAYLSLVRSVGAFETGQSKAQVQPPIQLPSGRLVLSVFDCLPYPGGYGFPAAHICISEDEGVTWSTTGGDTSISANGGWSCPCVLPDGTTLYAINMRTSGSVRVVKSTDSGDTWANTEIDFSQDFSDQIVDNAFYWALIYDAYTGAIYAVNYISNPAVWGGVYINTDLTAAGFEDKTKWTRLIAITNTSQQPWPNAYYIGSTLVFNLIVSTGLSIISSDYVPPSGGSCAMFYKSATGWKRVRAGIKI